MTENSAASGIGKLFFPPAEDAAVGGPSVPAADAIAAGRPGAALSAADLESMSEAQLQAEILTLLAQLQRRRLAEPAIGQAHPDGTLGVDSMTAVWVVATLSKVYGRKLVNLSKVDRDSLRSVGGLAGLVRHAVDGFSQSVGAA